MTDDPTEATTEAAPAVEPADEVREQIRAAEAAQQRSVCAFPDGDVPADLVKALDLRVEVNLAQYDGKTISRVGGADEAVRALEAPYSKRRVPVPDAPPQTRGSHRRRATKKASAKNKENS